MYRRKALILFAVAGAVGASFLARALARDDPTEEEMR